MIYAVLSTRGVSSRFRLTFCRTLSPSKQLNCFYLLNTPVPDGHYESVGMFKVI